jgi:hypothetical protein
MSNSPSATGGSLSRLRRRPGDGYWDRPVAGHAQAASSLSMKAAAPTFVALCGETHPRFAPHLLHPRPGAEKLQGGSRALHVRAHLSRDQLKMITEAVATGALGYASARCLLREKGSGRLGEHVHKPKMLVTQPKLTCTHCPRQPQGLGACSPSLPEPEPVKRALRR